MSTIIAVLYRELEGARNLTKACKGPWDLEEEVNRSPLAPVSAPEVAGVAAINLGYPPCPIATVNRVEGHRDEFETGK